MKSLQVTIDFLNFKPILFKNSSGRFILPPVND